YFQTTIFHPNVSKGGEICVNTLKKDWKKDLGITNILLTIKCLLIVPNAESALNEEAGRLLLEDYSEFAKRAKLITSIHAKFKIDFTIPKDYQKNPADSKSFSEETEKLTIVLSDMAAGNELVSELKEIKNSPEGETNVEEGASILKKRLAEKHLEKVKTDKKRALRRL
ncbi:hypothetical protein HK096_005735, partial [Nowakowskiella sp. JEL0078]